VLEGAPSMSNIPDERLAATLPLVWRIQANKRQHSNADRDTIKVIAVFILGWFLIGAICATLSSLN
jgi:hypothetical protein